MRIKIINQLLEIFKTFIPALNHRGFDGKQLSPVRVRVDRNTRLLNR